MAKDMAKKSDFFDVGFTLKNMAIGFAATIAMLFIVSWIAVIATLSEAIVSVLVGVITNICIGICGFRSARHSGSNGLISGAIAGLIYIVLLYIAGGIAFGGFRFSASVALSVIICILSGAIGGIIGINTRFKKRR